MALRFISSEAAREHFERVLTEAHAAEKEIVLTVDGTPVGMLVPLTAEARREVVRERFGRFWDVHKARLHDNPIDLKEDEVMDLVNEEIAAYRREKASRREMASDRA